MAAVVVLGAYPDANARTDISGPWAKEEARRHQDEELADDIERLELKWQIWDWLRDTPVNNVPPHIRLAAAAAWQAEHRSLARTIVLEAAMEK